MFAAPEIQASIVTLIGVIITVAISVYLSNRQMNTELKKLRTETKQKITDQLLEERLKTYPQLYDLISNFDKKIRFGTVYDPKFYDRDVPVPPDLKATPVAQSTVKELFKDILVWDSQYAVFLSANAAYTLHRLRLFLYPIIHMPKDDYLKQYSNPEELKELLTAINALEFALRLDLGIFDVEFSEAEKKVFSYENLSDLIEEYYIRAEIFESSKSRSRAS